MQDLNIRDQNNGWDPPGKEVLHTGRNPGIQQKPIIGYMLYET